MLCLASLEIVHVTSEPCYKETVFKYIVNDHLEYDHVISKTMWIALHV